MEISRQGYFKTMLEEYGYTAYQTYADSVNWLNYQGVAMPDWEGLSLPTQHAWHAAAEATIGLYITNYDI